MLQKPNLIHRVNEELAEIKMDCQIEGCDLAGRLTSEIQQARYMLVTIEQNSAVYQGAPGEYVRRLHEHRISVFGLELIKHTQALAV